MYVIYGSKVANSSQLGTVHMWSRERSNDQNQMKIMQVLATGVYGLKHHRLSSCVMGKMHYIKCFHTCCMTAMDH